MDEQEKTARQARIDTAREGLRSALARMAKAEHHHSARHTVAVGNIGPIHAGGAHIMTDTKDGFETEVRGRLVALEAILMAYLAHTALNVGRQGGDMVRFIADAMGDAEDGVIHAAQQQDQAIAEMALSEMRRISGYLVAHVHRYAAPMGSG